VQERRESQSLRYNPKVSRRPPPTIAFGILQKPLDEYLLQSPSRLSLRLGRVMKRTVHLGLLAIAPFLLFAVVRGAIALASHQLESQYPPPGRMIRVDGHRLHLYCTGRGTPTVLIEPGMGNDWVSWRSVSPKLAETTRVCVYDRAGYGWR